MFLSEINWGNDSAEKDAALLKYFVNTGSYNRLIKKQKNIIIGRKGSGKSALKIKLNDYFSNQKNTYVVNITPSDSLFDGLKQTPDLTESYGRELFFKEMWINHIVVNSLIQFGDEQKGKLNNDPSIVYAREIAIRKIDAKRDFIESISNLLDKLKSIKLGKIGIEFEKKIRDITNIEAHRHHLEELSKKNNFIILVDDLDLGWDNSSLSNDVILGLLAACDSLKQKTNNIHLFVFIREDMYNIIMKNTTHSDKYRDVERIKWEQENLTELLKERLKFNLSSSFPNETDYFSKVFPSSVGRSKIENWLIERTLNRPRELLQLSRIYTESLEESLEPNAEILKRSEITYSQWKLEDLCSEFKNQYPNLHELIDFWKTSFKGIKYTLSRQEINNIINEIYENFDIDDKWYQDIKKQKDEKKLLDILYSIGFIGDYSKGGGGGGSKADYSFSSQATPNFQKIQIHPCFRKAIGTKERNR